MASNVILIGNQTTLSSEVRSVVDQAQTVTDKIRELQAEMAEFGGDWEALAIALGFVGTSAQANAQAVYGNLLNAKTLLIGPGNATYADWAYFLNRMS